MATLLGGVKSPADASRDRTARLSNDVMVDLNRMITYQLITAACSHEGGSTVCDLP